MTAVTSSTAKARNAEKSQPSGADKARWRSVGCGVSDFGDLLIEETVQLM